MTDCDFNVLYLRLPNKEGLRNFTGFSGVVHKEVIGLT